METNHFLPGSHRLHIPSQNQSSKRHFQPQRLSKKSTYQEIIKHESYTEMHKLPGAAIYVQFSRKFRPRYAKKTLVGPLFLYIQILKSLPRKALLPTNHPPQLETAYYRPRKAPKRQPFARSRSICYCR